MEKGKDNIIFSLLLANLYIILLLVNLYIILLHITFVIVLVESKEISNFHYIRICYNFIIII